jgi:hypothetical protein
MTNGDKIRMLTNEQIADKFSCLDLEDLCNVTLNCYVRDEKNRINNCRDCRLELLNQEEK